MQCLLVGLKVFHEFLSLKSSLHYSDLDGMEQSHSEMSLVCHKTRNVLSKSQYANWKTLQIGDQIVCTITNNIIFGIAEEEGFNVENQENYDLDVFA